MVRNRLPTTTLMWCFSCNELTVHSIDLEIYGARFMIKQYCIRCNVFNHMQIDANQMEILTSALEAMKREQGLYD